MGRSYRNDVLLCRETKVIEPSSFKAGTKEKGQARDKTAKNLNRIEGIIFFVDQRGVQEFCAKQERTFRRKMAGKERANGIDPEMVEGTPEK